MKKENDQGSDLREQRIRETMDVLNISRIEAEFMYAIEIGEIDGDTIELQPGQNIDDILEK